ncbi:GTP binding protein [Coemansia biformis]|uniref:GTP binding protein n=1 Tax=Coemansia biformis TaxID=1286918 RepID=A0A9W7YCE7_9FUNG|nr:GTP binding protein [Coemansia biformis]
MTTRDAVYSDDPTGYGGRRVSIVDEGVTRLPPELDGAGNVEYKLQWRLAEGNGRAVYVIGVHDDGDVVGITDQELQHTIATLRAMAQKLDSTRVVSVRTRVLADQENRVVAEVHLAQQTTLPQAELRIAVLGDHGAGKSSILGCLTYGEADDGRGKARLNLLRHRHELESGRTSSIALGTVGFSADGRMQNYANNRSAEHIHQRSCHIATFIDTCGHAKHLKTTARAITGYSPHAFCVVIAADAGTVSAATRGYLQMAAALSMPLVVVVSKMDIAEKTGFAALMHDLLATLDAVVPGRSKCMVADAAAPGPLAGDMMDLSVVPIVTTSAVRSVGFDELASVLRGSLAQCQKGGPAGGGIHRCDGPFEFHIESVHSIDKVGLVATGWVSGGTAKSGTALGQPLVVGPDASGGFVGVDVTSIHTLRIPTATARAGLSAALAIQPHSALSIQKGMVVLDADQVDAHGRCVSGEFTAAVTLLGPEASAAQTVTVHIRSTCHLAHVLSVTRAPQGETSADSSDATVRLQLDGGTRDYICPGVPIVARDGRGLVFAGRVTSAQ